MEAFWPSDLPLQQGLVQPKVESWAARHAFFNQDVMEEELEHVYNGSDSDDEAGPVVVHVPEVYARFQEHQLQERAMMFYNAEFRARLRQRLIMADSMHESPFTGLTGHL